MTHHTALRQLLLPYLHQNWDAEFAHWRMAIDTAAKEQPKDLVHRALGDIDRLLTSDPSPAVLRNTILGLGISYDPGEEDPKTWLEDVQNIIRERIEKP